MGQASCRGSSSQGTPRSRPFHLPGLGNVAPERNAIPNTLPPWDATLNALLLEPGRAGFPRDGDVLPPLGAQIQEFFF